MTAHSSSAVRLAIALPSASIVNRGDSPVRPGDIQQALWDNPIPDLQEVIVIDKSGAVHKTFPN